MQDLQEEEKQLKVRMRMIIIYQMQKTIKEIRKEDL